MSALVMGVDGTAIDPNDKEAIIAAIEQVPAIEAREISDGWLIDQTRQIDCGNGMMKYSITLPDGSPLECTPFQIDQRRDMSKVWMATVKGAIEERSRAAMEVSRAAALKAKRDQQLAGAGLQLAASMPTPEEIAKLRALVPPPPPPPPESARQVIAAHRASQSDDPEDYARRQLAQAQMDLSRASLAEAEALTNKKTAMKAVSQWEAVLGALTSGVASQTRESAPAPRAARAAGKASKSRAEKVARKLETLAAATDK